MTNLTQQLQQLFTEGQQQGLLSGMVVAAGNSRREEFAASYGTIGPEPDSAPMPLDALFDIASVTKAVATTSAAAYCIDQGLLHPEAAATDYLPHLVQLPQAPITVRALATHYSGLDNAKTDHLPPVVAASELLSRPPFSKPYTNFLYSCRNFILLGWIVEHCSGMRLDELCQQHFFKPLSMHDTGFGPLHNPPPRTVPTNQPAGVISDEQARNLHFPVGNAGLFSTAGDLGRFSRALLQACHAGGNHLFGQAALKWLTRPISPPAGPRRSFGWDMRQRSEAPHRPAACSKESFGHSGWTGQSLWLDPRHDRYLVILTNRTALRANYDTHKPQMHFRGAVADLLWER